MASKLRQISLEEARTLAETECARKDLILNWVEEHNGKWRVCATPRSFIPKYFNLKGVRA